MEDNQFEIRIEEKPPVPRSLQSHRGLLWILVGVVAVIMVGALLAYFVLLRGNEVAQQEEATRSTDILAQDSPTTAAKTIVPQEVAETAELPDDGHSQWASPTDGGPFDCSYLLPGTQLVLQVRVANVLSHREGDKLLSALGPWGQMASQQVTQLTGVELAEIETLALGIRQTRSGTLDYSLRLRLLKPIVENTTRAGCIVPSESMGQVLVWCTPNALAELKGQGSEPPFFSRELQRVLERTDGQRIATLAFAGKFLQISGEKFLLGAGDKLRKAVVDFLGDEATASAISVHWDENFFLELQSTVALNERPHRFAAVLAERMDEASEQVEDVILAQALHPYGRKVLARFPSMLRKLSNYTRTGEDEKLSLLRCYLPVTAGHNLLMASELLLNADRLGGASSAATVTANPSSPANLAQRLLPATSLVFPKETLERALEMLSEDVGIPIQIAGRDLQLEGITKNQSFALELRDQPAEEILLAILLRANPDRTADGPTDEKQKLVYVVRESEDGQPGAIVVTTRSAAKQRGDQLPVVFQSPAR